jgi:Cu(I)/Ag(I) efflux system membrane fusion protein
MITPLKPHRGQHAGVISLGVLVVTAAAIIWTHHERRQPPPEPPKPAAHAVVAKKPAEPPPQLDASKPLETVVVREIDFRRRIEASGFSTFDESVTAHIQVPVRGWLVQVKPIGKTVRRGDPLATLYSPDIIAAELDLIAQVDNFTTQEPLNAARNKLARWGIPKAQIERVEKTKTTVGTLPVWAWNAGTVVEKQAVPGLFVEAWTPVYTITDPSRAWVIADLPENEDVTVGTPAKLTFSTGKPLAAKVAYVYSTMHKARFELSTKLARDAQVNVELTPEVEHGLAVPDAAVIRSGDRVLVYVMKDGTATAREIKLGTHVGGFYRVIGGIATGDTVLVNAQKLFPQS